MTPVAQREQLFAVLDTARDARLLPAMQAWATDARCLFEGPLHPAVAAAAPYVMTAAADGPLFAWWRAVGLGQAWGIALRCTGDLHGVRQHLRRLLRVQLPDGRMVLFRFWDPRVLRVFLPTCTMAELARLFGPVRRIHAESADRRTVTYLLAPDGRLLTR